MTMRLTAALAFVTTLAITPTASAADPDLSWFTFETEHFHVHFHASPTDPKSFGEAFARRTGAIAEEAYTAMQEALGWIPYDDVVHILCTDGVDGANGLARTQPYDFITVFAFGPESDTDLGRYDDWLRILVYHELMHVLHLNITSGVVPAVVNTLLGKSLQPNQALPRWFVEGIATWAESRFTGSGRIRSVQFSQNLRVAALEGTLPKGIGGLTGSPIAFPGASWAYTFGGTFVDWLVERFGQASLLEFVRVYGRRFIPFGINNVAREAFGQDFSQLYRLWREQWLVQVQSVVGEHRKQGLRIGRRLTHTGHTNHAAVFAPDGRLAVVHSDGYGAGHRVLGTIGPDGIDFEQLYQCYGGCGRAAWSPSGETLYSISGRWSDPYRFGRQVVRHELPGSRALPPGQRAPEVPVRIIDSGKGEAPRRVNPRARELDMRPDGRAIAYVTSHWGRNAIIEASLVDGGRRVLVDFDAGFDLTQPRYVRSRQGGFAVLFSGQRSGQFRDLYVRHPSGALDRLTRDVYREISPVIA
ncbi:MAG: hypothetical protein ACI9OJ_005344, partial [Myxococcota bacterium]